MSAPIDRRIALAEEIADWLAANGQKMRAQHLRGIRASLGQMRAMSREASDLRKRLTPIGRAMSAQARAGLVAELETSAAQLDRMARIADTGGEGLVPVEAPDAAYLADLLRRAAR